MEEPINLSFWDIERIQKEQDKHVTAYSISPIDKKKIAEYIDKEAEDCHPYPEEHKLDLCHNCKFALERWIEGDKK